MKSIEFYLRIARKDLEILDEVTIECYEKGEDCRYLSGRRQGLMHEIRTLEKILSEMEAMED